MTDKIETKRSWWLEGGTLGAGVILVLVLLGMVNYFGWKYYHRFDWTRESIYSLSDKTLAVLDGLEQEVDVVLFMDPGDPLYEPVREILDRYQAASSQLSVREVDAVRNLIQAQSLVDEFELTRTNVVVFRSGDDKRVVEGVDLADYDYSGMQFGQGPEMTGFKGEQVFTSAILELVEDSKPRIVFSVGHGEARLDDFETRGLSAAQELLGRDNFEIEEWESLRSPVVPEATDLVVVAGPTAGFIQPEIDALRDYLETGGRMLVLLDPVLGDDGVLGGTGLEEMLARFGARVGNDIVVDPDAAVPFFGAETFFSTAYGAHPITDGLSQADMPVIFPLARSVGDAGNVLGYDIVELVLSSEGGWGETDLERLDQVGRDDGDTPGPVPLGVAIWVSGDDGELESEDLGPSTAGETDVPESAAAGSQSTDAAFRLVVLGDSDFVTNGQLANVGNADLLANTLNWLVEREALVSIAAKRPEQVRLSLTQGQMSFITWLVLVILPGLAVAAGVAVYLRRRR